MTVFGDFLYAWLSLIAIIDVALAAIALTHAASVRVAGRLVGVALTLIGIILASTHRLAEQRPIPGVVLAGVAFIDAGLAVWLVFLPPEINRKKR